MEIRIEFVNIDWNGPFTFEDIKAYNGTDDIGVYQVCGYHAAYGRNALLYIGKTEKQSFGKRLRQERWAEHQAANGDVQIFLGRVLRDKIDRVERLLIIAHLPALNAKDIRNLEETLNNIHVLNWGNRGALLPEVSGARWSCKSTVNEGVASNDTCIE